MKWGGSISAQEVDRREQCKLHPILAFLVKSQWGNPRMYIIKAWRPFNQERLNTSHVKHPEPSNAPINRWLYLQANNREVSGGQNLRPYFKLSNVLCLWLFHEDKHPQQHKKFLSEYLKLTRKDLRDNGKAQSSQRRWSRLVSCWRPNPLITHLSKKAQPIYSSPFIRSKWCLQQVIWALSQKRGIWQLAETVSGYLGRLLQQQGKAPSIGYPFDVSCFDVICHC